MANRSAERAAPRWRRPDRDLRWGRRVRTLVRYPPWRFPARSESMTTRLEAQALRARTRKATGCVPERSAEALDWTPHGGVVRTPGDLKTREADEPGAPAVAAGVVAPGLPARDR